MGAPETCPLCRLFLLGLQCLLAVASYHNNREKTADDGAEKDYEDNGYADRPHAWGKEGLQRMVLVDEGLGRC